MDLIESVASSEPQFVMMHESPQVLPGEPPNLSPHLSLQCPLKDSAIATQPLMFPAPTPTEGMEQTTDFRPLKSHCLSTIFLFFIFCSSLPQYLPSFSMHQKRLEGLLKSRFLERIPRVSDSVVLGGF